MISRVFGNFKTVFVYSNPKMYFSKPYFKKMTIGDRVQTTKFQGLKYL